MAWRRRILAASLGALLPVGSWTAVITVGPAPDHDFETIGAAIAASQPGDTILISTGTYRENDLRMKNGLSLKAETAGSVTVDGGGERSPLIRPAPNSCVDGLILTGGERGIDAMDAGEFYVTNCVITQNDRTGVFGDDLSTPHVCDTVMSHNRQHGVHFGRNGIVKGCVITENHVYGLLIGYGLGEIRNTKVTKNGEHGVWIGKEGHATMSNCLITENGWSGVRMMCGGTATLIGCTVAYNLESGFGNPGEGEWYIVNTIVFGNLGFGLSAVPLSKISHSLVQDNYGGYAGKNGNIWANPYFFNPVEGDFSLWWDSPCVHAGKWDGELTARLSHSGSELEVAWSTGKDLAGNERFSGQAVDMGAYEYQGTPPTFIVESSSDLITWARGEEVSGFKWMESLTPKIKHKFYRVLLPE